VSTLPDVVADPKACPERVLDVSIVRAIAGDKHANELERALPANGPHDFEWIGLWWYQACRFCGGRHPDTPSTIPNTKGEQCPTTD